MPALIVAFAVGAYGFGSLLRGSAIIINEVAIVRGAPGATEGIAQSYFGVFSPTRGSYQIRVPGGALLSTPVSGDFFGAEPGATGLDVLQGDPSRVRDLGVGFGSLRTIRAESAVTVPLVRTDLRLEDGRLIGTVTNASEETILAPAVVLGGTVARLSDLAPGQTAEVDGAIQPAQLGQPLSDKVVGPVFFDQPRRADRGRGPSVRPSHDRRPADLGPADRGRPGSSRPTAPSSSAGPTESSCRSRSRARLPAGRATSCGSCRPTSPSAARPPSART